MMELCLVLICWKPRNCLKYKHFLHTICCFCSRRKICNGLHLQVIIESIGRQWSGSLHIGVTTLAFGVGSSAMTLPSSTMDLCSMSNADTWLVVGSKVVVNDLTIKENYAPSLERLKVYILCLLCYLTETPFPMSRNIIFAISKKHFIFKS